MNKKKKTVLGIIIFMAFLTLSYFAYARLSNYYKPNEASQIEKNTSQAESKKNPAPDFTVVDTKGSKVKLSDLKGKPVVLNFWASWCPPCKGELPHFNEVYVDVKDNVAFMMVDLVDGQRETEAIGQKYVKDQGYNLPLYFDDVDNHEQAAETYGISSIPTTLFIDSDGNIVTAYRGAIDKKTLVAGINLISK
jgi:Peroxiredoxin